MVRDGIIAGLIAAALAATWLLIYQTAHAQPGAEGNPTRAAVSRALLFLPIWFALVGILLAYVLVSLERAATRVPMAVIGALCLEVVTLVVLAEAAGPVIASPDLWWAVLVANVLAVGGMLAWFFVPASGTGRWLVRGLWSGVAREGILAGLVGASTTAVWFLLYDVTMGAPFRTPALLGAALLHGLRDAHELVITAPLVAEYTVIHGIAFILFGCAAAGLLALADREPQFMFVVFALFCCFEVAAIGLIAIAAEWLFDSLAWWSILAGNTLSTIAMLGVFLRQHRLAWQRFLTARGT
jgi:hypothetical protein